MHGEAALTAPGGVRIGRRGQVEPQSVLYYFGIIPELTK
jgi:hypothetical protein